MLESLIDGRLKLAVGNTFHVVRSLVQDAIKALTNCSASTFRRSWVRRKCEDRDFFLLVQLPAQQTLNPLSGSGFDVLHSAHSNVFHEQFSGKSLELYSTRCSPGCILRGPADGRQ